MEPNGRVENGIFIFNEPYKVNWSDWVCDHRDCESIILDRPKEDRCIWVVAYAMNKNANDKLNEYRNTLTGVRRLTCLPSEELKILWHV